MRARSISNVDSSAGEMDSEMVAEIIGEGSRNEVHGIYCCPKSPCKLSIQSRKHDIVLAGQRVEIKIRNLVGCGNSLRCQDMRVAA